jgi:hypothetical protein
MKTFKQHITEAFDKPYRWSKSQEDDTWSKYHAMTDAGDKLKVVFEKWSTGIVNIVFDIDGAVGITGEGDAFRVMATVLDIIKDYVVNNEPESLRFTANKEEYFGQSSKEIQSREKLYNKMIDRFASKAGYKVKLDKNNYSTNYKLIKK